MSNVVTSQVAAMHNLMSWRREEFLGSLLGSTWGGTPGLAASHSACEARAARGEGRDADSQDTIRRNLTCPIMDSYKSFSLGIFVCFSAKLEFVDFVLLHEDAWWKVWFHLYSRVKTNQ